MALNPSNGSNLERLALKGLSRLQMKNTPRVEIAPTFNTRV